MKASLTYFKPNGKYYSNGELELTSALPLWMIWEKVAQLASSKTLPGLAEGHSDFIILVEVPDHPHNHPTLIGVVSAQV